MKLKFKALKVLTFLAMAAFICKGESLIINGNLGISSKIRLNQIGYYPMGIKLAAIIDSPSPDFFILTATNFSDTVFRGKLSAEKSWEASSENARLADFSALHQNGKFVVSIPLLGNSSPFEIGDHALLELNRASIHGFYFQRASMALEPAYAGKWSRSAGHADTKVYIHPSAATTQRSAESTISSVGGWYDAGDYNKYIANSGISTYTLLSLYRNYSEFYDTLKLNIPENSNNIPDLLDEALYNFRWMLTMQDPNDGGVYHKLTSANFCPFIMPAADTAKRYVVQKSVTATLDLAAVAAYGARLFRKYNTQLPGLADSALQVARKAWVWARKNPSQNFNQSAMNANFSPAITTGEYGDSRSNDELQWAGAELYLATKEDSFFTVAFPSGIPNTMSTPSWPNVAPLGIYSLMNEGSAAYPLLNLTSLKNCIVTSAGFLRDRANTSAFRVPMLNGDYQWGGNSEAANQGIMLLQAFKLTGDSTYLQTANSAMDYLLGRNGIGYSYITGFGFRSPMHPHHRPSFADTVVDPVPGLMVGGPNPGQEDNCTYPSKLPALSWIDQKECYAANEIAINWNAPLAFLSGGLEATYSKNTGNANVKSNSNKYHKTIFWNSGKPRLLFKSEKSGRITYSDLQGKVYQP